MNACLKLGGDPNLCWHRFGIFNFEVPRNIIKELKSVFPKLKPLEVKVPLSRLPDIKCSACDYSYLPVQPSIEETLAQTHVHFSLVLESGEIFLFDGSCAGKIKAFLEEKYPPATRSYSAPNCRRIN